MINVGFNYASLSGIAQIIVALVYFVASLGRFIVVVRSGTAEDITFWLFPLIFAPLILFISDSILVLQGWRQDPLLQFKEFLITVLIAYLIWRELKS
jgi:hypothetical protein